VSRESNPKDDDQQEGWEGFAEEAAGGSLSPSAELEAAMREAEASHDARAAARHAAKPGEGDPARQQLEAELAEAQREAAEARDKYLRLAADFENTRRRALKDREEASLYGHQNLVKELLASVDNLERAIEHAKQGGEANQEGLLEGVELVLRELTAALTRHGVTAVEAEGQPFDPAQHEAMAQVEDASVPANTVTQVFQRGYQLRGRLLRPARVVVSKAPADDKTEGSS
jgi:molecular chaperone GrpE